MMLVGGKLGDIFGRRRAFVIGLVVCGVGSLTTALSPNVGVLIVGWSFVEAFGAILVIPAIAALTAGNYEGRDRAMAFGIIGGTAITPFGLSIVPFMLVAGCVLLALFNGWIERRERQRKRPLLKPGLVKTQPLRSGLCALLVQYLTEAMLGVGIFVVLGFWFTRRLPQRPSGLADRSRGP
jgi:MFS family permease